MREIDLKNMIVLKDIQSNIVDEAFVVLKENCKAWKTNKVIKDDAVSGEKDFKSDCVVKEAEMIVNKYLKQLENKNERKRKNNVIERKLKNFKRLLIILSVIIVVQFIIIFVMQSIL